MDFECHTLVIGKREAHAITNFIAHQCNCTHALSVVANFFMLVSTVPYVPHIGTTICDRIWENPPYGINAQLAQCVFLLPKVET